MDQEHCDTIMPMLVSKWKLLQSLVATLFPVTSSCPHDPLQQDGRKNCDRIFDTKSRLHVSECGSSAAVCARVYGSQTRKGDGEEMPRRAGSGSKSPEWSASVRVFVTRHICKCVDDTFSTLTLVVMGYKM